MRFKLFCLYLATLLLSVSVSANALNIDNIDFMTEEYPPYNFTNKGVPTGVSVDLLMMVFKNLGYDKKPGDISVLPWARGYYLAQSPSERNVLFATTRTRSRESLFKWVGPITLASQAIFTSKKSDIVIKSVNVLDDYQFAVIRGDVGGILLAENQVKQEHIHALNRFVQLVKKVDKKHTCCFVYAEDTALWLLKENGYSPENYKVVFRFEPPKKMYYAFNLNIEDEIVDMFQKEVSKIYNNKEVMAKIWSKYR